MRRVLGIIAVCGATVIVAIVAVGGDCGQQEPPARAPSADSDAGITLDAATPAPDLGPPNEPWLVPEPANGEFSATLEGTPIAAQFVIGAAGVYPPLQMTGTYLALPEPAKTMAGEALTTVEVYVRTHDGAHAFWGDVDRGAKTVELGAARSLTVLLLGSDGAPRPEASVRLALDAVGLVLLSATTDASGLATFEAIPDGQYVAMAELPGAFVASARVESGSDVVLRVEQTRDVSGVVRGPDGAPVRGATVAVYGGGSDLEVGKDVPADIVETDASGQYRATRIPGTEFLAVAVASGFPPGQARTNANQETTRLDVQLRTGRRVVVQVEHDGAPFRGAKVEWRDTATGAGGTRLSDESGRARFDGIPATARVSARFNHFESGVVELSSIQPDPHYEVQLELMSTDARIWRYRVQAPDAVEVRDLAVFDSAGVRCDLETADARDYVARACGDGEAVFEARTNFGLARWTDGAFVDGKTVNVPAPTPVKLRVEGANTEPWAATQYSIAGPGAVGVELSVTELAGNAQRVTASAYPGTWQLVVSNPRIGTMPFTLKVGVQPYEADIQLAALHQFSLRVVDRFGAALTGAYAMLYDDNGTLVDVSRSAGQLPLEFRVRPPFNGHLLVVDPQRGEGIVRLETSGDAPERVELDDRVLTHTVPASRPDRAAFERRTGVRLVERDEGWILDVASEGPGTRAGLQRGDLLVTAWENAGGLRVIVKRGPSYVDVLVR